MARTNEVGPVQTTRTLTLCCAKHLNTQSRRYIYGSTHPIHFLFVSTAAELYPEELPFGRRARDLEAVKRLGHFHPQMCAKTAALWNESPRLRFKKSLKLADQTDAVIESRYPPGLGPKQRIETKALLAAVPKRCAAQRVKVSHEAAGVITRRPRKFCLDEGPITLGFEAFRTPQDAPDCHQVQTTSTPRKKCTLLRPLRGR